MAPCSRFDAMKPEISAGHQHPIRLMTVISRQPHGAGSKGFLATWIRLMYTPCPARKIEMKPLKSREKQVLWYLCQGMSYEEISQKMGYAERTVRNSAEKLGRIFHTRGKNELVDYAIDNDLIKPTLEEMMESGDK